MLWFCGRSIRASACLLTFNRSISGSGLSPFKLPLALVLQPKLIGLHRPPIGGLVQRIADRPQIVAPSRAVEVPPDQLIQVVRECGHGWPPGKVLRFEEPIPA